MKPTNDWSRWGGDWQQQTIVDADRLHRRVRRKRWQMRAMVMIEALIALSALGQLVRLFLMPELDERWRIWGMFAVVLVAIVSYLQIRVRRGTWRAATAGIPALLQLTAARARVGVRLGWLNIASFVVLVAVTIVVAAPWLAPSRWLHDPALQQLLALQIGVNGTVAGVLLLFIAIYMRRQRRRLHTVEALLREYNV